VRRHTPHLSHFSRADWLPAEIDVRVYYRRCFRDSNENNCMSSLKIYLLGDVRVEWDGEPLPAFPTQKTRALFAYLVMHRQRSHTRSQLAGIFWGGYPETRALRNLSTTLWRLRRILPEGCLISEGETIAFQPIKDFWLDVDAFDAYCVTDATQSHEVIQNLEAALAIYRGDFLEGWYDDWVLVEAERLRICFIQVLVKLMDSYMEAGNFTVALECGLRILLEEPLREETHRLVMECYYQLGQIDSALAQYQACQEILRTELEIDPDPETEILYHRIRFDSASKAEYHSSLGPATSELLTGGGIAIDQFGQVGLIGRREERAVLLNALDATAENKGSLILIEGEPGVGKTRLVEEIAGGANRRGIHVLWGKCTDEPYAPLMDILTAALTPLRTTQITRMMDPALLDSLATLIPSLREHLSMSPFPQEEPTDEKNRLHRALSSFFCLLGKITPHLVILEDWHWLDTATLEALSSIAESLADSCVLFVGTSRGGELRANEAVWEQVLALDRAGTLEWVSLNRLHPSETEELIISLLGSREVSEGLIQQVYEITQGNPLFVIETLKEFVETRQIFPDAEGMWALDCHEPIKLPKAVQEVIVKRFTRLSDLERDLLEIAAVLTDSFDFDLWSMTAGVEDETLLQGSMMLLQRQFIAEGEADYSFIHDLIQQAIYDQIEPGQRRQLHRQAGLSLSELEPERVEELAWHFSQAQDYAIALGFCLKAGERARSIFAHQAALKYFSWAIEAVSHTEKDGQARILVDIYEAMGGAWESTGEFDSALESFEKMSETAASAGMIASQARAIRLRGWIQGNYLGNWKTGLQMAREALVLAERADDRKLVAVLLQDMGAYHNMLGEYSESSEMLNTALQRFRELNDLPGEAASLQYLATTYQFQGQSQLSLEMYQQALERWQHLGTLRPIAKTHNNIGYLCLGMGDLVQALESFHAAEHILRQIGAIASLPWVLIGLGTAQYYQNHNRLGLATLDEALRMELETSASPYIQSLISIHKGITHWQLGELEAAHAELERSLAFARLSETPTRVVGSLNELGRFLREIGSYESITTLHQEAFDLSRDVAFEAGSLSAQCDLILDTVSDLGREVLSGFEPEAILRQSKSIGDWNFIESALSLAEVFCVVGDLEEAEQLARQTIQMIDQTGWVAKGASGYFILGRVLRLRGQYSEAEAALQRGIEQIDPDGKPLVFAWLLVELALIKRQSNQRKALLSFAMQAQQIIEAALQSLQDDDLRVALLRKVKLLEMEYGVRFAPLRPGQIRVCLAKDDAPIGRALHDDELLSIIWTVDAGDQDGQILARLGKVRLRQARILRLLDEADQQGVLPTQEDLASALGVSIRTIRQDIRVLQGAGHGIRTRGDTA
jgi:predicted ATPase/DNA-binding SARP family transcriptional activator